MSFWVSLSDENDDLVFVDLHAEGGTYAIGGTDQADINVTYNYAKFYFKHLDEEKGLRWLHEKQAKDTLERLEKAVEILGTKQETDYWAATEGNAGHALNVLVGWAKQHPEGVWRVS